MPFCKITIVGTGLIGGSFGLALKQYGYTGTIMGCDSAAVLQTARQRKAIDHGTTDVATAIDAADLVVLATPVGKIIELLRRLGPLLPVDTLVTDVGGTKVAVMASALAGFGSGTRSRFLGGHPMAGKERGGVREADADLFQGATWLLTPLPNQDIGSGKQQELVRWISRVGARVVVMDPQEHDRICAWVSHLPQMIATALAATVGEELEPGAFAIGGRALREMTRIAGSPYSMWGDIAATNQAEIARALKQFEANLKRLRESLGKPELAKQFAAGNRVVGKARRKSKSLPQGTPGLTG